MVGRLTKVIDVVGALGEARDIRNVQRMSRPALDRLQADRLRALVRHAAERAPWHGRRLSGLLEAPLRDLPTMGKESLMANFDDAVCDRRLTLAGIEEHVEQLRGDDLLYGEFRVMTTSGTSGTKTYFAFDRAAWRRTMAIYPWAAREYGFAPRLPRRRVASLTAGGPLHMTYRLMTSVDIGVNRSLRLDVTGAAAELSAALQRFEPEVLVGYPSVLAALADEQLADRLHIGPRRVISSSEQLTTGMRRRITAAWTEPIDSYSTTETGGPLAFTCLEQGRMHVREAAVIVEAVDADDRPVPDGEPGHHTLMTSWLNPVQPILRYSISDGITMAPEPCPCGRASRVIAAIQGRAEDVLVLTGRAGQPVSIHPNHFEEPIEERTEVASYQVVHSPARITVTVVPRPGADREAFAAAIRTDLTARIERLGATSPPVEVVFATSIERTGGKAKLVSAGTAA